MLQLVVGFLPWIILSVLGNRWFLLAVVLALAAAAVTTVRQIRSRSLKILDTTTFAFFLFVLVCVFGFHWMILATYMSLLVNVTLMAIAWGSLLAGRPFTIQYAREQVAREFWHSLLFNRTNQYITAVWRLDFFLSALVSLYRQISGEKGLASQYAWVLFSLAAALFTVYFPPWYRARALRPVVSTRSRGPSQHRFQVPLSLDPNSKARASLL
jgi:all-trans-retinol 13,14-reductase